MTNVTRISIPDAVPQVARQAADITIAALRRLGADPWRIGQNPMGVEACKSWVRGEMTNAEFDHAIGILLILNPGLKLAAEA